MATINWALNVQVTGGPQFDIPKSFSIEAYEKIEVLIQSEGDSATEKTVDLQPSEKGKVSFLIINSNVYDSKLTYKVSPGGGGSDSPEIVLDQPHMYSGKGMISLLPDPKFLKLKNKLIKDTKNDALVEILVGRQATSPPTA